MLSHVWLFATPGTVAFLVPLSAKFSRHEHWSGLPCPPPGNLPNLAIKPRSPTLQVDSLLSEPPGIFFAVWANRDRAQLTVFFLSDCAPYFSHSSFSFFPFCVPHSKPIIEHYCFLDSSTFSPSLPPETFDPSNINGSFHLPLPVIN